MRRATRDQKRAFFTRTGFDFAAVLRFMRNAGAGATSATGGGTPLALGSCAASSTAATAGTGNARSSLSSGTGSDKDIKGQGHGRDGGQVRRGHDNDHGSTTMIMATSGL